MARGLKSGRLARERLDLSAPAAPPYDTGPDVLFVAYYATAEMNCHLGLGWPRPQNILDLYAEFRQQTNGHFLLSGNGLLAAQKHFGLQGIDEEHKVAMPIGGDGRNRYMSSPFRSVTGRNQPRNKHFIFAPAKWVRGLIRPGSGQAVAYIDWAQQEFGIAAALSGDERMMEAYRTGDPYLAFAKMAGIVPVNATKASHPKERDFAKGTAIAMQYQQGFYSLSLRLRSTPAHAIELTNLHKRVFRKFWDWTESMVDSALLSRQAHTVYGWRFLVPPEANPRMLANFCIQANAAEMLRAACILLDIEQVPVCATVHDAVLIEAPTDEINQEVQRTQNAMREASEAVLGGFPLRSEAAVFKYPDRFMDKEGEKLWNTITNIVAGLQPKSAAPSLTGSSKGQFP